MRRLALALSVFFIAGFPAPLYAQEEGVGRILILREAKQYKKDTVAVEAYLTDNILEAKVTARMYRAKPKIYNALIVGPKLGRLEIESKEVLLATPEDEEPYPTSKKDRGFITFSKGKENEEAKGALTREMLVFKIPRDRVVKGKKYKLWIQIMGLQRGSKYRTYKFDLENLAETLSQ